MELIKHLKWRYATKKFDPSKKVSTDDLQKIKEAVQLSASSYGLQLYKVLIINDTKLRQQLQPASWNQTQITDASHLLVFCHHTDMTQAHVDSFLQIKAEKEGVALEQVKGYGDFIINAMSNLSIEQKQIWMAKQTYIALGNLLAACGELKIDACPMEGFDIQQYNEILGLEAKGLSASVVATIGYRSEEDQNQHTPKVRRPMEQLFEII